MGANIRHRYRYEIVGGPYRELAGQPGDFVWDHMRGEVKIHARRRSAISWPLTKAGRGYVPILAGDLIAAVATESVEAIAERWGCSRYLVRAWRRSLGVNRFNAGTRALWRKIAVTKLPPARAARTCWTRRRPAST